ncbi:MAG: thioredoxin fold domain-containing protein [Bacteroidota bacterium]|nr:thioredoxin fold domain-containing protein [Bacteroidota bacterium]
MKQLAVVLCFSFLSFSSFSQGEVKTEIQWLSIEKAEVLAEKYKSDMLIFFFRDGCPECKRMKAETLKNSEIIKIINENFFPVILDARTKDTLEFNGKKYFNQQPKEHGKSFRHDLYHELVKDGQHQYVYPYIIIINGQHHVTNYLPGFFPKERLKRSLQKLLK